MLFFIFYYLRLTLKDTQRKLSKLSSSMSISTINTIESYLTLFAPPMGTLIFYLKRFLTMYN